MYRWLNPEPNVCSAAFDNGAGIQKYNFFVYCANNPVMFTDYTGEFIISALLIGAGIGLLIGGTASAVSQGVENGFENINWAVVGVDAVSGAISGALAATGVGLGASIGINAALGGGTYVAEQIVKDEEITAQDFLVNTIAGGVSGAIGGKGVNSKSLSAAYKSASNGITRELRRANIKYATKRIAKYTMEKVLVMNSAKVAIVRFGLGAVGNVVTRWKLAA